MSTPHKTAALLIIALMLATSARAQQVVQNRTYEGGEQEQRNSMESISTADSVIVKPNADVQWESLTKIHLMPGFHAQPGAKFTALVPDPNAFVLVVLDGDNQSASPGAVNARPFDMAVWQHGGPVINMPVTFTVAQGGGSLLSSPSGGGAGSMTLMSDAEGTVRVYYQQPTAANVTSVIHVTSNGKAVDLHSYNFNTPLATGNNPVDGNGNGSGSGGSGNTGNGADGKPPGWKIGPECDNPAGFVVFSPEGDTGDADGGAAGQASVLLTPALTGNTAPAPYVVTVSSIYDTNTVNQPFRSFDQATGNSWSAGGGANNYDANGYGSQWIQIYLGQERTLTGMRLRANYGGTTRQSAREFVLEGSIDGLTWETIFVANDGDVALGAAPGDVIFERLGAYNKKCSYIRMTITRIWPGGPYNNGSAGEIEYYGY